MASTASLSYATGISPGRMAWCNTLGKELDLLARYTAPGAITRVLYTTPAEGFTTNTATKTTPTFDVALGDLITIFGYTAGSGPVLALPTWTGSGTVTPIQTQTGVTGRTNFYLWTISVTAAATARTISVAMTNSTLAWGFHAVVYRGHGGLGVSTKFSPSGAGAPSFSLSGTTAGSIIEYGFSDYNGTDGTGRAYVPAGSTEQTYATVSGTVSMFAAYRANAASGAVTLGMSAPTGQLSSALAVEIKASAGAAGTYDVSTYDSAVYGA